VSTDLIPVVRTILHRLSATISGIDGVDNPASIERFRWFVGELTRAAMVDFSSEDHAEVIRVGLEVRDQFVNEYYGPSEQRRRSLVAEVRGGRLDAAELPSDLLTIMLLHEDASWPEGTILREVCGLYINASTSTTLQETTHALVHLLGWLDEHPEDGDRATDLEFIRTAAHHALRMHTTAPALLREAVEDVELKSGLRFQRGDRLALILSDANRDPAVFGPDANDYDPRRQLPAGVRPWGLTFGSGPHTCIGKTVVTGYGATADQGTAGSLALILHGLLKAGISCDPDDPPRYTSATHIDAFDSFPVIFSNL
jgi:cytochrome P450